MVSGGFGTGKTTMVGAISEVRPLFTEAPMTQASEGIDRLDGVESKTGPVPEWWTPLSPAPAGAG
ncbi:hypothetical protein [Streptomyces sp. NPDC048392]|uniref:hypothetical protein n=1 Tax=Streptomyces sp. NPDC048392 TaxID=3365543 RepID=UPI00371A406B